MSNIQKAQEKINTLARWLDERDYCDTRSLTYDLERAQREITRITNRAIAATISNLDRFIEQARMDARDETSSARYRQMAETELKKLYKIKNELENMQE